LQVDGLRVFLSIKQEEEAQRNQQPLNKVEKRLKKV
jgi:hypothetical protein